VIMPKKILRFVAMIFVTSAWPLLAQTSAPPSNTPPASTPPGRRAGQEPCWRQAGISQSVMEQHHAIERDTHSQIEAVCENSSLTPRQKQEQVKEIREQARQKIDGLITPEQQETLHSCQQARAANRPPNEGYHRQGGPCGNFASSQGRQGSSNGNAGGDSPQPPTDSPQH